MITQVALTRAAAHNGAGTAVYKGNPFKTHELVADGEATNAKPTEDELKAGWNLYRVETDTPVYVKLGSTAAVAPRFFVMAGSTLNVEIPLVAGTPPSLFVTTA